MSGPVRALGASTSAPTSTRPAHVRRPPGLDALDVYARDHGMCLAGLFDRGRRAWDGLCRCGGLVVLVETFDGTPPALTCGSCPDAHPVGSVAQNAARRASDAHTARLRASRV